MKIEIWYEYRFIKKCRTTVFLLCASFINSWHFSRESWGTEYNNNNIIINNMLACLPVLSDRDFFIQQKTQQHYEYHHHQKTCLHQFWDESSTVNFHLWPRTLIFSSEFLKRNKRLKYSKNGLDFIELECLKCVEIWKNYPVLYTVGL